MFRPTAVAAGLRFEPLEERRLLAGVPELLAEINPGGSSDPAEFVNAGGTVFFSADDGAAGPELWKTDGTMVGTVMVKDIGPLAAGSTPTSLTAVGGTLFFSADDGTNGVELWKSDGTLAGTTLVKDIDPAGSSSPSELINIDSTLYFQADDGTNGIELWKSDGTELGTTMVMEINAGGDADPRYLTNVDGKLFFSADNGLDGRELWLSDPDAASTMMVKDINAGGGSSYPGYFGSMANVGGVLFFSAFDPAGGFELWKSDGTMSGTTLVKDVNSGAGSSFPFVMANVDGVLFFSADDDSDGFELWKSDGTMGGTTQVKDINTDSGVGSMPDGLANVGGTVFFRADDGTNGVELWKSDGTFAGTEMVLDVNPSGDASPRYLTDVDGTLYFRADDGTNGVELWMSDGTAVGTSLVDDIAPAAASSIPRNLQNVSGNLFFTAQDAVGNDEPWIVRATAANVVATHLFYNESVFDGHDASANVADDAAIATDKTAYLIESGPATFASVSSYSRGINGVMFDLAGTHGTLSATDFTLQVGTTNMPASWPAAPAPLSVAVRVGAGIGGSDRVTLIWAAGAIEKTWLQVSVNANFNTNLAAPYAFLFGSAVGDTGLGNSPTVAVTSSADETAIQSQIISAATVTSVWDMDRNGVHLSSDRIVTRTNAGALPLLNAVASAVTGRHVFYDNSKFDNLTPGIDPADNLAIATDKTAYLPGGGVIVPANMTSYSRGLNGIFVDLTGTHGALGLADFGFKVSEQGIGANNSPSTWAAAPAPTAFTVLSDTPVAGTDRVEFVWADNAIENRYLEVRVFGNDAAGGNNINTGLTATDIFYFGNILGDTFAATPPTVFLTTSADETDIQAQIISVATITSVWDMDRNGSHLSSDLLVSRANAIFALDRISIANPPSAPVAPGSDHDGLPASSVQAAISQISDAQVPDDELLDELIAELGHR